MSKRILFAAIFMVAPLFFSNVALAQEAKTTGIEEILVFKPSSVQSHILSPPSVIL